MAEQLPSVLKRTRYTHFETNELMGVMSALSHNTIATWLIPILKAIEPFCDAKAALTTVGIDPQCVGDADQRVPLAQMQALWELAERVSGDDCIGLESIKHINPTSFHAITYAHHASSSLRESLERLNKFSNVISTAAAVSARDDKEDVVVTLNLVEGAEALSFQAADAFMAIIVLAAKNFLGNVENPIRSAKFKRLRPRDTARHQAIFKCPLSFASDDYEIRIAKSFVDQQVPTGNAELVRINEQVLAEYLSRFNKNDLVAAVYSTLIDLLPEGEPTREKVCEVLGISSRHLHRKLADLGTSYKGILEDTRKRLALQYIEQRSLAITTIAYQLGFLDSSSFARSFKRWTGLSPSDFRKRNSG